MTGPHDSGNTRPISVAELLAKNGTIGAPVPAHRRRRRGNAEAISVAELTGEIPVLDEDIEHETAERPGPGSHTRRASAAARVDEVVPDEATGKSPYWSEPEPRWPESTPPRPPESRPERGDSGPQRSPYPLPVRNSDRDDAPADRAGAEGMNPDPLEDYAGMPVDVMDTDVRDAEVADEDSAYVRSYLGAPAGEGLRDKAADDIADIADIEEDYPEDVADDAYAWPSRTEALLYGGMIVLQSILAVAFGAGLFIAFDELWRWNNIVALVLSVLVILGLVVGVRVVRKTEDIGSTLIAVAVGALVTLGPLALLQSG